MEITLKIVQFILSISILVILHELGHFIPAILFKTRAEKFFLFFDPWFSLFSLKKVNGKWQYKFLSKNQKDTETIIVDGERKEIPIDLDKLPEDDWRKHPENTKYGIGWLPMGGYVKIAGMVDESMDLEKLKKSAEPWEFRSKPAWQRLIIMLGGVTVNFFLAWIIYSCLSFNNGEAYIDVRKFKDGIGVTEASEKMGFKGGDRIISIDGQPAKKLENVIINTLFSNQVTVEREGKEVTFKVNEDGVADVIRQKEAKMYIMPRIPMIIDSVVSPNAIKAGIQKGDHVLAVNGVKTPYYDQIKAELGKYKNQSVALEVKRKNRLLTLTTLIDKNGNIGVIPNSNLNEEGLITKEKYSLLQSIPRGFERTIDALTMQIKQFKLIFNSKVQGYKNVGGPIAIVNGMNVDKDKDGGISINWTVFWSFTALFSVWLAFLNLIPIPGLDGGHVLFTLWEIITRKPVPQKVLENAQMIGVIFLLGLMALIFGNDIVKLIF